MEDIKAAPLDVPANELPWDMEKINLGCTARPFPGFTIRLAILIENADLGKKVISPNDVGRIKQVLLQIDCLDQERGLGMRKLNTTRNEFERLGE
jgi:hypothetical protein